MISYENAANQIIRVINTGQTATARTSDGITLKIVADKNINSIYNITIYKRFDDDSTDVFVGNIYGVWKKSLSDVLKKIDEKKIQIITDPDLLGGKSFKSSLINVLNAVEERYYSISFF